MPPQDLANDQRAALDARHLIHPWTDFREQPVLILEEGNGVHVRDSNGHEMIDGIGGMWCVNIGYGRKEMAQAIAAQAEKLCYYSPFGFLSNTPSIELAAKLAAYAPGDLNRVFFTTGGSTAVDTAMRLASFYFNVTGRPDKRHVITRDLAYHGSTHLSASLSGKPSDRGLISLVEDTIHHIPAPNPYRRPDGMTEAEFLDEKVRELEDKILELGPENVACFIAEPILASGGVIVPPAGYHRRTLEICRRHDVLYISDEVVTGFGRNGAIFASEPVYGIVPDMITCAKGLTSGYVPLGAVMVSDRIYQEIAETTEGRIFANGFTYSSHPVACAAGLKNLEIMEREDICGHVREVGPYFLQALRPLLDSPIVGDIRGSHLMACVEYVSDKQAKTVPPQAWRIAQRIIGETMPRGLMVRPMGSMVIMSPPLIITKAEIDELAGILREATEVVTAQLRREGLLAA
ncbi:aminotransferase [Mesorhizobium comanense]|uniref:aminotransferase n=1 Tax=Mesorhizobium comanense TaxID=2502215 RepID=UPI0010F515DA|nr:aminotransferase [Mesorhizobium comanense]